MKEVTKPGEQSPNQPILLFDIGDLLSYFQDAPNPSGIQRVSINLINTFLTTDFYPLEKIKLIVFSESAGGFVEVSQEFFLNLIENIKKPYKERPARLMGTRNGYESMLPPLEFNSPEYDDAYMILTGAPWGYQSLEQVFDPIVRRGIKIISFIHDIIPLKFPSYFGHGLYQAFRHFLFYAHNNFDAWIFVSEFTKKEVCAFYASQGLPTVPHVVAPLGGSDLHTPIKNMEINEPFVLMVSTLIHTKNHIQILRAWQNLLQYSGRSIPKLILVGRYGTHIEETLSFLEDTRFLDGHIEIRQNISDEELASLYAGCLFTVFPSLYEGWGLPVSESLCYGKVCLCSNAASMPEAGGEFCDYFTPGDDSTLMPPLERLLFDDAYRREREEKIRSEYLPRNWKNPAQKVLEAIKLISDVSRPKIPVLLPGEYSFSAFDTSLEGAIKQKAEIPDANANYLVNPSISMQRHFLAESIITSGRFGSPEAWGRWGAQKGTSIEFQLGDPGKKYLIYLQLAFLADMLPCNIQYWHKGTYMGGAPMRHADEVIYFDSEAYTSNGVFSLELRPIFPEEFRNKELGIGLRNLLIVERDDLMRRVRVLEKVLMRG